MHRIIKQAQWLKANMPYDLAKYDKPVLTDAEALDIAAYVNDDDLHHRPGPKTFDYPHPEEKAIDYGKGPFMDTFSEAEHKFGPYEPIISFWKNKGLKPTY
jgi:thiosulfate dehydrogenase